MTLPTNMMAGPHKSVLARIASSNVTPSIGPGFDPHGFVPAFTINSRVVADALERRLNEANISVTCQKGRLVTQFFVAADQLDKSLGIRDQHLSKQPDMCHADSREITIACF